MADAVATGLAVAGGRNLEVHGTNDTAQCLALGLVDEIYVHVLPVLLGAGVPLYVTDGMRSVNLELLGSNISSSVTSLRYRVRGSVTRLDRELTSVTEAPGGRSRGAWPRTARPSVIPPIALAMVSGGGERADVYRRDTQIFPGRLRARSTSSSIRCDSGTR